MVKRASRTHPLRRSGALAERRFEVEVAPHLRALKGLAWRLLRNASDAEDLVQETLLRAFRGFHRYAPGSNAGAWLRTILHRARIDSYRRRAREPQWEPLGASEPPAPTRATRSAELEGLQQAVAALPPRFREALIMRHVHELTYAEISYALKIPLGTVMSRIHRGRLELRRSLYGSASRGSALCGVPRGRGRVTGVA